MRKKKIVLTTNSPWLCTGLAENGKFLAKHLHKTGKYDLVYYCSQSSVNDPNHQKMPWKSIGCVPPDHLLQPFAQDGNKIRSIAYGSYYIDEVVKNEKPDILLCSDDAWAFQGEFINASWFNKIHSLLHITLDSLPILPLGYEQAKKTPNFFTWAKFAKKEMNKNPEFAHVKQIYGITDTSNFSPLSTKDKTDLRKRFNISPSTVVFGYTFRNQLRKEALNLLTAFAQFKKENPNVDVKVHLHTSFSETAAGWDFPRIMQYLGLRHEDVLCTYVCPKCKNWHIHPYIGENINCPYCGAEKSMTTANIGNGVGADEMKQLYSIRDATISPFTSGGQEFECVNTLLCGLPLACTNYSSGEDFCELPFVFPIKHHVRFEAGSSFIKASNDVNSIKNFINQIARMPQKKKDELAEKGRDYAVKTFSPEVIGKQWEDVFDALPPKDWSSITLEANLKDENYPFTDISDNQAFVKSLYNNILKCEPDPKGFSDWIANLQGGVSKKQIYDFFIKIAKDDNSKISKPMDFGNLLDKNGRKRALLVIKQSIGDCIISTQLFESLKEQYIDTDLYVACDPQYFEVFEGNPNVHKILPYQPFMEQEMACIGTSQTEGNQYFDYYFHTAIGTQRILDYLSADKIALPLT